MFSAQAQVDCCFQLSNPAADTLHNIANLPNGDLPLTHTLNVPSYQGTDTYELVFSDANCLAFDSASRKVSIELELWCDGENLLDGQHDLSRYCDITLQTKYNELHWLGAPMMSANYPYAFEYPGAVKIFTGTYNISNVNFDYFYFDFLVNSQTRVIINWHTVYANVQLIAHIRERINGTDNEFYWDDQQRLNLGGHMSHPSRILASDTLSSVPFVTDSVVLADCEPYPVGMPLYTMDSSGIYHIAYVDTSCGYRIDSVVTYNFTLYEHPTTPTLSDSTFKYCQKGDATPIVLPAEPNPNLANNDVVPYWYFAAEDSFYYAPSFTPVTDTTAGDYYYYVKRHDNTTGCESEIDTFKVTINPNPAAPTVTDTLVEYCVGETAVALSYTAPTGQQVLWGTTPTDITSTTAPVPATTAADTTIYYLKLQDTTTVNNCVSEDYDSITVVVYANPTVTITNDNDTLCFGDKASMTAAPTTLTSYQWKKDGVDVADSTNTHFSYTNDVTDTTVFEFSVAVTELHVVKSCSAMDTVEVLAYPEIGAPTAVRGDTAICGPGTVTREVANGAHASTSTWYAKDKTTVLGTGTTYTQNYTVTDTLYVSSSNDFGCETPNTDWLRIIVRVDSIPQITLTTDHVGDSVCAEEDLIIRSSVVPTGVALTYEWKGTGLVAPLYEDSVTFNYATAGTYTDTLKVTITSTGCFNHATIDITVDSLPIIQRDINYTVDNSTYCVGANGKIEFLTPDYVRYSIDTANTWRTTKVFDTLAAGNYGLVVEDARGCKNHVNYEVIIKDTTNPALTITNKANTRCEAEYNGKLFVSVAPAAEAGVHAYKYQLDDGTATTDSVFSQLVDANTYKITVTDTITGCKTDSLNQVVANERVNPNLTLAQTPNTHCDAPYDGTVAVTAMVPADSIYRYKIVKNLIDTTAYQFDTLFDGLMHGFYTVIAQDTGSACLGSDTITVQYDGILPTGSINALPEICYDGSNEVSFVPGDTSVVFDSWVYSGPVPAGNPLVDTIKYKQSFNLRYFPAGKHIFTANFHDTITHCSNTVTDTLRVIDVNINLKTIPANAHVCSFDSLKVYCEYFKDEPEDSLVYYNWYATIPPRYVAPGVYDTVWTNPSSGLNNNKVTIVVVDNHGCSSSKSVYLDVWPLPELNINVADQNYCQNDSTNLVSTPNTIAPYTYSWKRAGVEIGTDSVLKYDVGMNDFDVTLSVQDGHGCFGYDTVSINVIEIPGAPIFTPDTQYFCDNDVHVDTTHQATPTGGTFTWLTPSPNVAKVSGTYAAYYVNTENSVSCYSDKDTVVVDVTGKPTFTLTAKYNSETTADTGHVRCFEAGVGDTLHIAVNPVAVPGTLDYIYKIDGVDTSADMIITKTDPGVYVYTVYIKATAHHPGLDCYYDTTITYTLKINSLPTAPANFPYSYNGGDSTIFYCQGSTAVYNFTLGENQVATYNGATTAPTTAYDNVVMVITDTMTHCSSTFNYDIVEVATPTVKLTSDLADDCSDTLRGKVIATVTPAYDATYERVYTWTPASVDPASPHSKYVNTDTVTYTFRAPNDTIVTANVTINAVSGPEASYSASCASADSSFIVTFQPAPQKPVMSTSVAGYVTADSIAYCDGSTFTITATDFTTSTGATINMVDGNITESAATDAIYRVVANNNDAPYCPSDTLYVKVHKKRTPAIPVYDTVYYCSGTQASYTLTALNANDTIMYLDASGTTPLAEQPKTAGKYTIRVLDKLEGCSKDSSLVIVEVALPTATISISPNWHNDTICEGNTISETYTFTITPHVQHTAIETFTWKDIASTTNTATLTATPTADTSVTFIYHLIDTAYNSFSHVACAYNFDSTITYIYLAKPAVPVYLGDTLFCAGDSIVVGVDSFYLATASTELYSTITLPVTYKTTPGTYTFDVQSQYTYYTSCKSTVNTIIIKGFDLPNLSVAKTKDQICFEGDTSVFTASSTTPNTYFVWGTTDTIASINVTDTVMHHVQAIDDHGCVNKDSAKVTYYPIFTVALSPDTTVCVGDSLMISATVTGTTEPFDLTWYKNDINFDNDGGVLSGFTMSKKVGPDSSAIVNGIPVPTLYKIGITDSHGCSRDADLNVIKIAATNRPGFIFHKIDSTENIHYMEVNSGDQAGFEMIIKQNCGSQAERVFVDVRIYKDGVEMTDAELGSAMNFIVSSYNTSYEFEVTHENAPALESVGMKSSYFGESDYFFPNSELINYNHYNYDWFYMHFLDNRKITVRTGAWKPGSKGVYTFSFAVVKAGPHCAEVGQLYKGSLKVGGYNGHVGLTAKDTVAFDTFTIYVDTTYVGASTSNFDNTAIVTTAPDEEPAEAKAINMNVYPNPASNNVNVVMTGVKGQTVITVHDMSGKAVTSMKVDVDSNGQVINLPVDNYSQGIYFIKVVNGSAIMTKKLIIAR